MRVMLPKKRQEVFSNDEMHTSFEMSIVPNTIVGLTNQV